MKIPDLLRERVFLGLCANQVVSFARLFWIVEVLIIRYLRIW